MGRVPATAGQVADLDAEAQIDFLSERAIEL